MLKITPRAKNQFNRHLSVGPAKLQVAVADTLAEQINGLSGFGKMCRSCGMIFVFPEPRAQHFWMRGMKFSLDFVFIREGRVVEMVENVLPPSGGDIPRVNSTELADMVLELNAGFVAENGITISSPLSGL